MRVDVKAYREASGVSVFTVDALDEASARRKAEEQGYRVLSTRAATVSRWAVPGFGLAKRFSVELFAQELLALLDAGMGLVESVALLARKAKDAEAREVLAQLDRLLAEGKGFAAALEVLAPAFPVLFVASVRAAETTGNVNDALRRYLDYRKQLNLLRDKILSAAIYPTLLLLVGTAVILFLLIYVVPRFSRIFEDVGDQRLPFLARWLMHFGQWVGEHWAAVFVGGVAAD